MTTGKEIQALREPDKVLTPTDYESVIAIAEKRIAAMERVKKVALRQLKPSAFTDWNGTPRLTADAAEHVGRHFGVSWKDIKKERIETRDEDGPFYFYMMSAVFSLPNTIDYAEAVGTAGARDDLWATRWEGEGKDRKKTVLPVEQINEQDVIKKAISNMIANGVPRLLGMADLTYEDLAEVGIKEEDVKSIRFKGKTGDATKAGEFTAEDQKTADSLRHMLTEMSDKNEAKGRALLKKFSAFTMKDKETGEQKEIPGRERVDELTAGRLKNTHRTVKKAYDDWMADTEGGGVPYEEWSNA